MASWLDILANPGNMTNGRLNPFAVARGFTQQGRQELDAQNQVNVAVPQAQSAQALFQAFDLGRRMATAKQLDAGQLGSFDARTLQEQLTGQQLGNQANQQAITQQETLFNQGQQDARARVIQGRPMTPQGANVDLGYRQDDRAQRSLEEQMRQFGITSGQNEKQIGLQEQQLKANDQYRQVTQQQNQAELQQRGRGDLLQALTSPYSAAMPQVTQALMAELQKLGMVFPEAPKPQGLETLQRVREQVVGGQQTTQPQQQTQTTPMFQPAQRNDLPARFVEGTPEREALKNKGFTLQGSVLDRAFHELTTGQGKFGEFYPKRPNRQQSAQQLVDLQQQLDRLMALPTQNRPIVDEIDRLRSEISRLMKEIR